MVIDMVFLLNDFFTEVASYQTQILSDFGGLTQVARGISAIAAVIYLGGLVLEQIATLQILDERAFLRPFIILLIIITFPYFRGLIDVILSPMASATTSMQANAEKAYDTKYAELQKIALDMNKQVTVAQGTSILDIGGLSDKISLIFSKLGFFYMVIGILMAIVTAFMKGAIFLLLLFRVINLVILIIFGPVSWAFSIFPIFQDTWKQWIANYINVFMWYPILNIIEAITYKANTFALTKASNYFILTFVENIDVVNQMKIQNPNLMDDLYSGMAMAIGVSIAGIYAVSQVPQIANMIVQTATGGAVNSTGTGNMVGRLFRGAASGTVGVTGRGVGTVAQAGGRFTGTAAKYGFSGTMAGAKYAYNKAKGNSKVS